MRPRTDLAVTLAARQPAGAGAGSLGLFWAADSDGTRHPVPVEDRLVNNLKYANDASIRAHNYWGNLTEFVPGFAALVESALK